MKLSTSTLAIAGLVTLVQGHGLIVSPRARFPGPAMIAACGSAVADSVVSDNTSNVESEITASATNPNFDAAACNLFLCKGLQFDDNAANVETFTPGQVVNIRVSLPIPHEGPANVSVVDTATNTIIGDPLIEFDTYADENLAVLPANNTNFDITIPTTLGTACATPGACVIQWFWFGTGAAQTYESCIDFITAGAPAAAPPAAAPPADAPPAVVPSPVTPAPVVVAEPEEPAVVLAPAAPLNETAPLNGTLIGNNTAPAGKGRKSKGKGKGKGKGNAGAAACNAGTAKAKGAYKKVVLQHD